MTGSQHVWYGFDVPSYNTSYAKNGQNNGQKKKPIWPYPSKRCCLVAIIVLTAAEVFTDHFSTRSLLVHWQWLLQLWRWSGKIVLFRSPPPFRFIVEVKVHYHTSLKLFEGEKKDDGWHCVGRSKELEKWAGFFVCVSCFRICCSKPQSRIESARRTCRRKMIVCPLSLFENACWQGFCLSTFMTMASYHT